jgi:hypothetical protein
LSLGTAGDLDQLTAKLGLYRPVVREDTLIILGLLFSYGINNPTDNIPPLSTTESSDVTYRNSANCKITNGWHASTKGTSKKERPGEKKSNENTDNEPGKSKHRFNSSRLRFLSESTWLDCSRSPTGAANWQMKRYVIRFALV